MRNATSSLKFIEKGNKLKQNATTGISLHCHTFQSKEILDFVPYYAERIPVVSLLWRSKMQQLERMNGSIPDFKSGYWEPPLHGAEVVDSETDMINKLGLDALVSITDHDTIAANVDLRSANSKADIPISMEWTVPFENAFFHIGIHNLPVELAETISKDLLAYTYAAGFPDDELLSELLGSLHARNEILIVLNHPIWDIEMIGQAEHEAALDRFLDAHQRHIHAIEVNGFRTWSENLAAIDLANGRNIPIVSGGDRHCCQNNTMINVTNAETFSEFVDDIRTFRQSQVVVLPEYHKPLPTRQLASIANILSNVIDPSRSVSRWSDRVLIDFRDGNGTVSLDQHWKGRIPLWASAGVAACRLVGHRNLAPMMNLLIGDIDIGRDDSRLKERKSVLMNGTIAEA